MYTVLADDKFLHIPISQDDSRRIASGKAVYEIGKNGTMDLIIPVTNAEYDSLQERKTIVRLIRSHKGTERCIYQGLYMSESDGLDFNKEIKTDGFLVVLNDTNIRPYHRTTSPKEEFIELINEHNSRTDEFKRLNIGDITVSGDAIYRSSDGYTKTKDAVDNLVSKHGGYVRIRTEGNRLSGFVTYIDWIEELSDIAQQKIRYGSNIIDITRYINTDNLVTRIIPLGTGSNGVPITIKSVNDGIDYLEDQDAIDRYGIIEKIVSFDLESPMKIKEAGQEYLDTNKGAKMTIELKAIDLADAGYDVEHLNVGDWVHCVAVRYKIDTWMQIQKHEMNFMNISQSRIVLGATLSTFTRMQNAGQFDAIRKNIAAVQGTASGAAEQAEEAGQKASEAVQEVLRIRDEMISTDDIYPIGSIYISKSDTDPGELFGGTWKKVSIVTDYNSWMRVEDKEQEE